MRQTRRRLLSLLMAFAILCSMIPAAFAAEDGWTEGNDPQCTHEKTTGEITKAATCTEPGEKTLTCTECGAKKTETIPATGHTWGEWKVTKEATCTDAGEKTRTCTVCKETETGTIDALGHDYQWKTTADEHWKECSRCGETDLSNGKQTHTFTSKTGATSHWQECSVCGYKKDEAAHSKPADKDYTKDGINHSYTCICGYTVSEVHKFNSSGVCTVCGYKNTATPTTISIDSSNFSLNVGDTKPLTYTVKDANGNVTPLPQGADIRWYSSDSSVASVSDTGKVTARKTGSARIYVMAAFGDTKLESSSITVTVKSTADLEITISEGLGRYTFDDDNTLKGDSLYDQLDDALYHAGYSESRDYSYLTFSIGSGTTSVGTISDSGLKYVDEFDEVEFTVKKAGKFTASYTIKDGTDTVLSGEIIINVEEGPASAGDVIYTSVVDKDVTLDVKDFEEFWEDEYSKGALEYVTFGSISSRQGSLVDGDGSSIKTSTKCYVSATSKQVDLDKVTFEPKKGYTGAVTVDFTAHGTNNSKKSTDLPGTLVILYTKNEPKAVTYSVTSGKIVTLDGDDFLANYKDTMGASASTLQIRFLDVPANGTLYYNYNEKTEKGTALTSKNVDSYLFSTSSKASRSIEDVTYVPDSKGRSDTVKFACYSSSGDLRYYGEVTFGVTVKDVTVSLTSTSAGVTFNSADFFSASEDMLTATYLTFGSPSSGTLYKNWTGVTGTSVATTDKFSYVASVTGYTSLSSVTYVPNAGYSGTVTIPFSAYTASGTVINGTVSIKVTATSTVVFTDVPTTGSQAWAYPYITRLASAGVVGGITPTTYGPKQQVKWGAVLKMVLLGAGHPAQTEGTGANWAANYLTYAYQKGIVSSDKIDLSKPITRLEMAELAAKALGLSAETSIKTGIIGPTDTTNGYVYALYNRGIVGGDSSSGKNCYNPNSTLLRDEMAKIVCGVMDNAK